MKRDDCWLHYLLIYAYMFAFLCPLGTLPLGLSTDEARWSLAPLADLYVSLNTNHRLHLLMHVYMYTFFLSYRHTPTRSEYRWSEAIAGSVSRRARAAATARPRAAVLCRRSGRVQRIGGTGIARTAGEKKRIYRHMSLYLNLDRYIDIDRSIDM